MEDQQIRVSPAARLMEPTGPCHADQLPAELLQLVLSHLELPQLCQVQRVSRRWRDAVLDLLRRRQELDLCGLLPVSMDWTPMDDDLLRRLLCLMPDLRVLELFGGSDDTLDIIGEWGVDTLDIIGE